MIIKPVITEKSLSEAQKGNYTFYVDRSYTKYQIKKIVEETFEVKVVNVRTINIKSEHKKNYMGRKRIVQAKKKAIVTLGGKDKIDLFEEKKGKKK